ncbi:YggS family pyridoxal phosphate-dependent enzyme [Candidatus Protochlamydia phocaeensis]|uniref:YggS family pyridoxal phosphate-dependent enzyme n=1 Tax=Candidatus Protochlamydia phocaeensis TaxID=1414722 RepID=UPI0008399BDB|nr:YggS family pyridoxal phosphate-dependent enzyme [Candidatus Protochlamydia phocaeensis]
MTLPFSSIAERYRFIQEDIQEKALKCGRRPEEISLIAVTKTQPLSAIQEAYEAGCRQFGENRLQEALMKMPQLPTDSQWHLIGTLQSNKVNKALDAPFCLIHSVDSLELAQKINQVAQKFNKVVAVLLQVNTSLEASKHGLTAEQWQASLSSLVQFASLRIEGLMTIAPFTEDEKAVRACFRQLYQLRENWKEKMREPQIFRHLSMGMSHDYGIAIQEGATLVRIGTAIFGSRI